MSFPPLPLLCSQHRLVDNYCDRHQNEPEGEDEVGHCVPHSPALCTLAWVGDFTMIVAIVAHSLHWTDPCNTPISRFTPVWLVCTQVRNAEAPPPRPRGLGRCPSHWAYG